MTHAQRVAGRELLRAAVMAERAGEQRLADMLGDLPPLPQRLDLGDALAAAELVFLYLVRADHSSLALLTSQTEATTLLGRLRVVGVPMLKAERISCSGPKLSDAQIRNFEAIKHR